MTRIVTTLISTLLAALPMHAENVIEEDPHFITVTTQNGLASNVIYDICTDRNGCVWLGTAVGLSRYDGTSAKNYFKEEMGIRSNFVNYVFYDSRDRVWAGSANGVAIYDINKERFFNLEQLSGTTLENRVAWFFEDQTGTMWVSFKKNGLISIDPVTFKTKQYFFNQTSDNYFSRIWFEPENNLYLATSINDGLHYIDLQNETSTPFTPASNPNNKPFAGKQIKGLTKIDSCTFCLASSDGQLYMVDPYRRKYEQLPFSSPEDLRRTYRVSEDKLLVITKKGFILYDLATRTVVEDDKWSPIFKGKSIHCIAGNLDKGLIVGTHTHGMAIEQDSGFEFMSVIRNNESRKVSLKGSNVSGFAEANDSTIWVSTRNKGLFRYSPSDNMLSICQNSSLPEDIEEIGYNRGFLWIMSSDGIYKMHPESGQVTSYREGACKNLCMRITEDNKVIVMTDAGVIHYDENTGIFQPLKEFSSTGTFGIGKGFSEGIVAATAEKGLVRWTGNGIMNIRHNRHIRKRTAEWPDIIFEDYKGRIWSAPSGSGIIIHSTDGIHQLNTRSGLSSDIITNIIADDNGNIFITTDRSLIMLPPTGKMRTVTKSDGLLNFGFSRDAAFKTSTGDILLGSRDGFTIITQSKAHRLSPKTTLAISSVWCNGTEIPVKGNKITLNHRQNSFDISITDIDPYHLRSGKSLYCIEGHDETWAPAGEDMKVSYTGLKPGSYTLRAFDQNIEPIDIRIKRKPLLSIVAITLYILTTLALSLVVIIFLWRRIRRRWREKILDIIEKNNDDPSSMTSRLIEFANNEPGNPHLKIRKQENMTVPPPIADKPVLSVRDKLLLAHLNETVSNNYTNPDFGVDELADAMGLSRSSLNRKMRDILQTTANNYIRERRIEKAEELLRTSSLQINEICYKVGFQTPSYFIKCFRKKYGKSPNEYANSAK